MSCRISSRSEPASEPGSLLGSDDAAGLDAGVGRSCRRHARQHARGQGEPKRADYELDELLRQCNLVEGQLEGVRSAVKQRRGGVRRGRYLAREHSLDSIVE
jgi:hypothetical protein